MANLSTILCGFVSLVLTIGLSGSSVLGNSTLLDNQDNAQGSLVINSDIGLALVTIQNSSAGVMVKVGSACPPEEHQCASRLVYYNSDMFIPSECHAGTCEDILTIIDKADVSRSHTMHYTLMVPVVKATLLLKFEYVIDTQYFQLKESHIVSTVMFGCNPIASVSAGRSFYTLCQDLHQLHVLELENAQNVSEAFYVRSTDHSPQFNSNSQLSGVYGVDTSSFDEGSPYKIVFGIGTDFYVVDITEVFEVYCIPFTDCKGGITRLHPIPLTFQYTLLYCHTNYGVVDISLDSSDVSSSNYSEAGYPIVCPTVSSLLNITNNGTQTVLHYFDKAISLTGDSVIVNRTRCFEISGHLFIMYTDSELGVFVLNLNGRKQHTSISSSVCLPEATDSCSSPKVFNQQYILLQEGMRSSLSQNTTMKVFDVLQSKVVSVNKITFSPDIVVVLKVPPVPTDNTTDLRIAIPVPLVVLLLLVVIVVAIVCVAVRRWKRRVERTSVQATPSHQKAPIVIGEYQDCSENMDSIDVNASSTEVLAETAQPTNDMPQLVVSSDWHL